MPPKRARKTVAATVAASEETAGNAPGAFQLPPLQASPAHHVVQAGGVPDGHAEDNQPRLPPGARTMSTARRFARNRCAHPGS